MFTNLYTCPTCGTHAVEVTETAAPEVTVSRCESDPAWVASSKAPKVIAHTWATWTSSEALAVQHREGLVTFAG